MFVGLCNICKVTTRSVSEYVAHGRRHRNQANSQFRCCFQGCRYIFSTFTALKVHITRKHRNQRHVEQSNRFHSVNVPLKCAIAYCKKECSDLHAFLSHLKSHMNNGQTVECPYVSCKRRYHKKATFCVHLSRCHRNWCAKRVKNAHKSFRFDAVISETANNYDVETGNANKPTTAEESLDMEFGETEHDNVIEVESNSDQSIGEFLKSFALFLLKLQGKQLVPESTVQIIVEELRNIHDICLESLKVRLTAKLRAENICNDRIHSLLDDLNLGNEWDVALDSKKGELRSKHSRKEYFKSLNFVSPEAVPLGRDISGKMHYCHYVPILQTIKVLIDNDLIPIKSDRRANNMQLPVFTDITDGKIFKENTLFGSEENALSVILFQDAFEVVNPLGSAKKKHKILAVYFTLGNIPPQYRSQVESLQLALLCREVDFKKYGQEKVFKRLLRDLKLLEETGVQVKGGQIRKGSLACILGDNLGSHTIGGFVESFSSKHYCRYCLLSSAEFQSGEPYALGKCRSPTEYDRCVEHLQQSGEDSFEGIKFNSLFNNLNYFHVCNPGLPPCLGHDLFEGVVDYDLKLYIDYWVNQRHWFTYQDLNRKLELFKFTGSDINNKPAQINSNKSRLGGNAVENWCLLKLLPILVGQQILDKSDNVWKQFLRLREIVQLVCAPQISWDEIVYLKVLIEEYHEERKQIFPDVKLRPKHHFLCHYPELTVKFGPLIRVWTLRFESKHSYFKRCARNCHNFVNVTHTLSERHQQLQAYNSAGSMFPEKNFIEKGEQLNPEIFSPEIRASLQSKELQVDSATVSNKLKVYGTQYSAGLFVACKCTDSVLQFGCILLTLLCNNDAFLVVKLHNATLLEELGVYLLQPSNDIDCLKVSELCDYYPLSAYPVQGRLLLPLKHNCFHS